MKKLTGLMMIAAMLVLSSTAVAGSYYASGVTGDWDDTVPWGGVGYPVAGDVAYLNLGSTMTVDGTAEEAAELHLASWSGNSDLVTLNIANGGSLDITGWTYVGVAAGDFGLLSVDATSTFTANSALNVGYNGNGTLDVNGGTVNALGGLFVSNPWAAGTGAGSVNLNDGIINVSTDFAMSPTGLIDIHAGTLSIYGLWWDNLLTGYIDADQIVGYGDTQTVNIDHVGDYTVLTAVPEPATLGMLAVFGGAMLFIRRKMTI